VLVLQVAVKAEKLFPFDDSQRRIEDVQIRDLDITGILIVPVAVGKRKPVLFPNMGAFLRRAYREVSEDLKYEFGLLTIG
jgi:hypothetical protein